MTSKYNKLFAVAVDLQLLLHQLDSKGLSVWTDAEYQKLFQVGRSVSKRLKELAEEVETDTEGS